MPERLEQGADRLETLLRELDSLMRRPAAGTSANGNVVRLEGAGSIWNGIAIGIALGAVVVCTGWVATTLNRQSVVNQQAEAYQKAVYMLAPRFAEEIDKELERHKEQK